MWPTIAILLSGAASFWANQADHYYQHRLAGEVRVVASASWFQAEAFYGMVWWGRHDAKIPANPFNAEADRAIERPYGAVLTIGPRAVRVGATAYRRHAHEFDREQRWGVDSTVSGHPYSIGYHDGLRPIIRVAAFGVEAEGMGPWVVTWNEPLTLPAHDWRLAFRVDYVDVLFAWGGTREGVVADFGLTHWLGSHFGVQIRGGWIEPPSWGKDIPRAAAVLVAH